MLTASLVNDIRNVVTFLALHRLVIVCDVKVSKAIISSWGQVISYRLTHLIDI